MAALVAVWAVLALLHLSLLRLPFFWDEAGYFVPAAHDIFLGYGLIARTTLTNGHPPLVMLYLAAIWRLFGYSILITRLAMLVFAAVGALGCYELGRRWGDRRLGLATAALSCLYPTVFAQSTLAQLDIPLFALTPWILLCYLRDRRRATIVLLAAAMLAKETAAGLLLSFILWELAAWFAGRQHWRELARWLPRPRRIRETALLLFSAAPLASWYAYHRAMTGHILGDPALTSYNTVGMFDVSRLAVAFFMRLWQACGHMGLLALTAAAAASLALAPREDAKGHAVVGLGRRAQSLFALILFVHCWEFTVLGGALLARYMAPLMMMPILLALASLRRRLAWWGAWAVVCGAVFLLTSFTQPPWGIAPEDNLTYAAFVRTHQQALGYIDALPPSTRVMTAWPANDELSRTYLGYVKNSRESVELANFSAPEIERAARLRSEADVLFCFSSKYEPVSAPMMRFGWWRHVQQKNFGYHDDLDPAEIAARLGGRVVYLAREGGEWAAVIELTH